MLAILYLAAMVYFGDCLCRRFYRFASIQQRIATAFLVGLLLSSGITYLGSLAFAQTSQPLVAGNIIFLLVFALAAFKMPKRLSSDYLDSESVRPPGDEKWDWLFAGIFLAAACWLMFSTLSFHNGNFQFGFKSWTDFGANLSLSQSFALGHNFPSEHPFFPGEPLRYHFLFWFQAANLSFLGLNLVWSVNLLSIFSLMALLILIMTFTELLFGSRAAARIAAILFFFPASSLSYIPFLQTQTSFGGAIDTILKSTQFLPSGYPFRGEDWGALTISVFGYQRHLISAVGIFFVVMVFLVDFYRHKTSAAQPESIPIEDGEIPHETDGEIQPENNNQQTIDIPPRKDFFTDVQTLIFSGLLIGALPYWNSAVFVAASLVFGSLLVFFPYRRYLAFLIGAVVLVGLPQVLILRSGHLAKTGESLFQWGYTIVEPTVPLVAEYIAWTFGFKLILILIALIMLSGAHRRLFLAVSSLLVVVFLFRLSVDSFNNHKLINIWNVFAVVYVAYALWRIGKGNFVRGALATVLALAMIFSSVIDFFPVRNDANLTVPYDNDRLTVWLIDNTKPSDVFLTYPLLTHPILFSGRKIFLGNTLFAWAAGYQVAARENVYRQMYQETNLDELVRLLRENKIAYVAIDDSVRGNDWFKGGFNEFVYKENFEKVFEDTERRYYNLTIYKVPEGDFNRQSQPNRIIIPSEHF